MLNILYCIPALYNPGGMERILTEKINHLSQIEGAKIILVTTDQMQKPLFFKINPNVETIHLDLDFNSLYRLSLLKKIKATKQKLKKYKHLLINIIKEKKIDICVSTGGKELEFLYSIPVECKKILEIHFAKNFREQFLLARKDNYLNRILGKIRTKQLEHQTKNLDAVVVLTKEDQKVWEKTHNNIHQIYNFSSIVTNKYPNYKNKKAIAIGKLDAQKGFDMLIDAWAMKKNELHNWELNIFGQGEWKIMLEEKINKYGLQKNIFLKGITKNTEKELLDNSLFLFPSRYEGFGLALVEAMSCGLPAVSFNCPQGPSEIIDNYQTGILIPPNNISEFAEGIVQIASDEIKREKMGKNAKQKALKFSKKEIMQQWVSFFKKIKYE